KYHICYYGAICVVNHHNTYANCIRGINSFFKRSLFCFKLEIVLKSHVCLQLRILKGGHTAGVGSLAWNSHILTTGVIDGKILNN
ncbi:hypothetical protein RYX36_033156, partial [Vicia faba]